MEWLLDCHHSNKRVVLANLALSYVLQSLGY